MKNETEKYTLNIVPVGDHLEITIPELGITVSTEPGQIKRDQAVEAGNRAITQYWMERHEQSRARAS